MTPKEKAKELFDKMYLVDDTMGNYPMCFDTAKQCALIAVDEILNSSPSYRYWGTYDDEEPSAITFWKEVKQEIEKL